MKLGALCKHSSLAKTPSNSMRAVNTPAVGAQPRLEMVQLAQLLAAAHTQRVSTLLQSHNSSSVEADLTHILLIQIITLAYHCSKSPSWL
jgi:hypothetical protein